MSVGALEKIQKMDSYLSRLSFFKANKLTSILTSVSSQGVWESPEVHSNSFEKWAGEQAGPGAGEAHRQGPEERWEPIVAGAPVCCESEQRFADSHLCFLRRPGRHGHRRGNRPGRGGTSRPHRVGCVKGSQILVWKWDRLFVFILFCSDWHAGTWIKIFMERAEGMLLRQPDFQMQIIKGSSNDDSFFQSCQFN